MRFERVIDMKTARFFNKLDNSNLQCTACSHKCRLSESETGLCGVRKNIDGTLQLIVYGKAASLNPDPIEKKPLYHFQPGTRSLSIGTYGCNFFCTFCQNHELSQPAKTRPDKLVAYILDPETIVNQAVKLECPSISYTYSEPTTWAEYTLDTIVLAREKNIKAVYVSNGYQSDELLNELIPVLDAINIDLKAFTDDFYRIYAKARLRPVLENIKKIHDGGVHVEITTLMINGLNDSTHEIKEIASFIHGLSPEIPWHISRFMPQYQMLDKKPTSIETMVKAYNIGKETGLNYVYLGNVRDSDRSSTYCPSCGEIVIYREAYLVTKKYTADFKCKSCGGEINITN